MKEHSMVLFVVTVSLKMCSLCFQLRPFWYSTAEAAPTCLPSSWPQLERVPSLYILIVHLSLQVGENLHGLGVVPIVLFLYHFNFTVPAGGLWGYVWESVHMRASGQDFCGNGMEWSVCPIAVGGREGKIVGQRCVSVTSKAS